MLRYDNSPGPGRETCIGSAHSAQLQTQQRGDETWLIMTNRHQGYSTVPYWPAPSYFIHKNRGLWQLWTAVFCWVFFFRFFFFLHGPLRASGPQCSCIGCTADTYATGLNYLQEWSFSWPQGSRCCIKKLSVMVDTDTEPDMELQLSPLTR